MLGDYGLFIQYTYQICITLSEYKVIYYNLVVCEPLLLKTINNPITVLHLCNLWFNLSQYKTAEYAGFTDEELKLYSLV